MNNSISNPVENSDDNVQEILGLNKFIILSILSLGLYPLWWFYKAWRFFKEKDDLDVIPVARTLFSYIFISSLFSKIQTFAQNSGYTKTFSPALLHVAFVAIILLGYLPEPYSLFSLFNFIVFIQPLEALNYAKMNTPGVIAIEKTFFNTRQIVLIVIGGLLLSAGIYGALLGIH